MIKRDLSRKELLATEISKMDDSKAEENLNYLTSQGYELEEILEAALTL